MPLTTVRPHTDTALQCLWPTLRASLSGTFLHSHSYTPSIAFRHLPPQSLTHSEHRFPAPSSTVTHSEHSFPAPSSTVTHTHTLRASLSGTFLRSHSHTPNIAFRHIPPQSLTHSEPYSLLINGIYSTCCSQVGAVAYWRWVIGTVLVVDKRHLVPVVHR